MRTVQIEYLRPGEILEEQARKSIAYLPMGPLEWHGVAMPYGTDPLVAQEMARQAAQRTGGVVMPTLFFGTERERPAYILRNKGFEDPENMYVLGMDVPQNSMKSYYAREEVFALMVREHLRMLAEHGYKLIVLLNGHGASGQVESLKRLAVEFSNETASRVLYYFADIKPDGEDAPDYGHGTLIETAMMRYLADESVKLSELPPRDVPLNYRDWGIADNAAFGTEPPTDNIIKHDPRDATPEIGKKYFDVALDHLCERVEAAYAEL